MLTPRQHDMLASAVTLLFFLLCLSNKNGDYEVNLFLHLFSTTPIRSSMTFDNPRLVGATASTAILFHAVFNCYANFPAERFEQFNQRYKNVLKTLDQVLKKIPKSAYKSLGKFSRMELQWSELGMNSAGGA